MLEGSSEPAGDRRRGGPLRLLAIDTSLSAGSVAAAEGPRVEEVGFGPAQAHARRLTAALAEAAAALGWSVADADAVAVIRGPGSFTGLRVGTSVAKGLAWAAGMPLVSLCGFEVVADAAGVSGEDVHVAFDAGRGEVVAARVNPAPDSPGGWSVGPTALVPLERWLAALPPGAIVSGPALDDAAAPAATRDDLRIVAGPLRHPSASRAIPLAMRLVAAGCHVDPALLVPVYSRPSYAQENPAHPSP